MSSYANLDAREGTVNGEQTLTFNWKPRKIVVTNDDATKSLLFKFNTSETFGTLKATETITFDVAHKEIIISGSSVAYRIWAVG